MRFFVLLLVLLISLVSPAYALPELTLSAAKQCPGDIVHINATADGQPAPGVELRIVLYLPYQGLVALQHSAADGTVSVELKKGGTYRIYMYSQHYLYGVRRIQLHRLPSAAPEIHGAQHQP